MSTMDRNHSLGHSASRSRRALRATFALVGRPVYHTTLLLLDQETEAAAAVADIYRRISTDELAQYDISTQEQLLRTAVQVEVKARIKALLSRDPHVFDLPKGGPRPQPLQADDHTPTSLLQALPTLYRFLFVLSALWDYDRKELKKLFRLDDRSLDQALSALPAMVEGLVRPSSLPWNTYEAFVDHLKGAYADVELPPQLEECAKSLERERFAPVARRKIRDAIAYAAIIIIVLILAKLGIVHW